MVNTEGEGGRRSLYEHNILESLTEITTNRLISVTGNAIKIRSDAF
jgi:hypothetical protein